jgi:transposase-like protein
MQQNATEKLSQKQERALLLLMEGKTITEVAQEVGVNRSTIHRWKSDDPVFMAELNQLRRGVWDASQEKFLGVQLMAIDALSEMLQSDDVNIRMKAINIALRSKVLAPNGPTTVAAAENAIKERENDENFTRLFTDLQSNRSGAS